MKTFFCLLLLSVCLLGFADAITFTIPPRVEECFYEEILKGTDVGLEFIVVEGGARDIDVTVAGPPRDEILYSVKRDQDGKYYFVAHLKGTYTFCFSNTMSTVTSKTVLMRLNIGNQRTEEEIVLAIMSGRESDDDEENTIPLISPLQSSIMQLADGLHSVQAEEKYMRTRERIHRDTTESTNSRILFYSLFENMCLIAVSVWQVFVLRRFFEVKRAV